MTDSWTDEELATLLANTFASHESLADPEIAQEVAASTAALGPPDQRRWPAYVAAVASVVVVAGVGAYAVANSDSESPVGNLSHSPSAAPGSTSTTSSAPVVRTYAENRAAAAKESARIVELAPLPAGADRLDDVPDGWPTDYGMSLGPSDGTLTRTAWWSIPLDADSLETYLLAHDPPGMRRQDGVGGGAVGIRDVTYSQNVPPDPEAFTGVSLLVEWREVDGRSLVKVDTYLAAREVRTRETYIDETVTAVEIDRVEAGIEPGGGGPLATVHLTEPADHARITHLVDAVNGLYASTRPVPMGSCRYPGNPRPSITVTFHTSAGVVALHHEQSCWGQVEVRRDGHPVGFPLDPSLDLGDFASIVDAVADAG